MGAILLYGDRLETGFGDGFIGGVFRKALAGWGINFVRGSRPESAQGFVSVAKRWVVEPVRRCGSIAWTNLFSAYRQGLRVYSIFFGGLVVLANIQMMLQRIKPTPKIIPQYFPTPLG
ncbi:hypothetical protein [Spirosoma horti]